MNKGITLIALIITVIAMLVLAGVSITATVGENGIITNARNAVYTQSTAILEEFLQTTYAKYSIEDGKFSTPLDLLKSKHPEWFYQNSQGYILDSEGHVLYLIKKSGLPEEIKKQISGGEANKVSQYYRQEDVYGTTSDLLVYYCKNGTDTMLGLTREDLDKDNPLEVAYEKDTLLAQMVHGNSEEPLSMQDLKSIKTLTIDTVAKLAILQEFKNLPSLVTVHFKGITIPTLEGLGDASNITELRFTSCSVGNYSAIRRTYKIK